MSFSIPPGPLRTAATAFAIQARVSIDVGAAGACGESRGFFGRASADAALEAVLHGTGCVARRVDARAYQIVRRAIPPPAPVVRPDERPQVDTPPPLSELVVVATRRPTLADRLAYSVSALDSHGLATHGVRDAADIALAVPAMTVTNLGPGRDKVILRGLSDGPLTGQTQSMVGIYLDDVRLTYNAPNPDLLLTDVAQVEVLRGPQGALYGAGSLGGVLQLVTRRPNPSAFDAWTAAGVSSVRGGGIGELASGMVNVPMFKGRAAARLVAYAERESGYIDDPGQGRANVDRTRRSGARLSLRTALAGDWIADAGVVAQAISSRDTHYATPTVGPYARRNRIAEPHDNDFLDVHLGAHGTLWGQQAKITLAAVRHDLSSRYDASAAPPVSAPAGAAVAFDDDNHVGAIVAEASLASKARGRIQWQLGAFVASTRQGRDGDIHLADASGASLAHEWRRDVLDESALFGQAIGELGRGWSLTLGARLFANRTEALSLTTASENFTDFKGRQSYTGFAPKVVLSFAPSAAWLFYVQSAEGYRSGGYNTSVVPGQIFQTDGGEPARQYEGDELWSFETGAKASLMDGRLRLRSALFLASWRNIQSDQVLSSGLPYTANIGDGRNIGIEFEGAYVQGGLRLDASFLVNNPQLESVDAAFEAQKEVGLAAAPRVSAALSATREWPLENGWRVGLDSRVAYVGRSRLSFDAVTAPRMGNYATVRTAARLAADRWELSLAVDNLFDSQGDTFAYGNPFTLRTLRQTTPQRPRTLSIELRVRR